MSPESARTVCAHLEALGDPLFALLDAARDPKVLAAIRDGGQPYQSLYEGPDDDLAEYGPYLVQLDNHGTSLARLVADGWGRSWGVYLTSPADFESIRHHFRRYLKVEIPGAAAAALFRFYDPRVLREFLACWTLAEREAFHGPVSCFAIEDAEGSVTPREYQRPDLDIEQPSGLR